jgi:4-amino-4-deoxy-L-arabinose transferase-like glycosyltransferase
MGQRRIQVKASWMFWASLLLVLAIRLPYIDRPFNDEDVAQIAYSASRVVEGQLLYRDTVELKPVFTLAVFAFAFRLFGKEMAAVNALAILWAMAATVLVFLLTRNLFGHVAARGAALFYAVFANSDTVNGTSPSYDFWMLPFMVAAVYCLVQASQLQKSKAARWLLASGVCSGLATTSKQHALFNFIAILNYLVIVAWRDVEQRRQLPKQLWLLGGGFVLAWLPSIVYFWAKGGLSDYWAAISPATSLGYILQKQDVHFTPLSNWTFEKALSAARLQLTRQISRDTILWGFALAGLLHLIVNWKKSTRQGGNGSTQRHASRLTLHASLLGLWALWSFIAICLTKRFYDHYFVQMIPVFSVLAGYVWGLCFEGSRFKAGLRWGLVTIVIFGFLWSGRRFHVKQMARRTYQMLTRQHEPTDIEKIAAYVRVRSTPQDTIFVCGWKPEIYYFADRRAASKWWEHGLAVGLWPRMAEEFKRYQPKFIVMQGGFNGPPEFRDYVRRNFVPDTRIAGFEILRRRPRLARDER